MLPTLMFGSLCARVRSFSVLWLMIGLEEEKAKRLSLRVDDAVSFGACGRVESFCVAGLRKLTQGVRW
jgi:hypothetical protein